MLVNRVARLIHKIITLGTQICIYILYFNGTDSRRVPGTHDILMPGLFMVFSELLILFFNIFFFHFSGD